MTNQIEDLVKWAEVAGTHLHKDVEVYQDPVTGLSFRAKKQISPNTTVVTSHHASSLSYLNAIGTYVNFGATDSFPLKFLQTLKKDDPNVIGYFFLMQQYLLREQSPWWPYIRMLPQPDSSQSSGIPIWWPKEDQIFLAGTNAEPPLKKRVQIWEEQWRKGISLLQDHPGHGGYTYLLYQWAATIFDSRSFRPSLTIDPEGLVLKSSADSAEQKRDQDHIRHDRFSILYPLLDIGNHNGLNQVEWKVNGPDSSFELVHTVGVPDGEQIYNFYGNKSNSELLSGYGFILPSNGVVNRDVFHLKLKPDADRFDLRKTQSCYTLPFKSTHPDEEFMFSIEAIPSTEQSGTEMSALTYFPEGLIDLLCCIMANDRERSYLLQNPQICPQKLSKPFQSPLSRAILEGTRNISMKLAYDIQKIEDNNHVTPQNDNQSLASRYRLGQLSTLRSAYSHLTSLINQLLFATTPPLSIHLLSIEQAYHLLVQHYPALSQTILRLISEDQEEPLPLDWSVFAEDWNKTYWILWIYVVCLLYENDNTTFFLQCPRLGTWMRNIKSFYESVISTPAITNVFHGAKDELTTLATITTQLHELHPEIFPSLQKNTNLVQNMASLIVRDETFVAEYEMLSGASKGEKPEQMLLFIWEE
ncbi:hypothetical protein ACMFMG_002460 [Clarireedia jacksonii]